MAKLYRETVMAALHAAATGRHEIGMLVQQTRREFDELCLMSDPAPRVKTCGTAELGHDALTGEPGGSQH